MLDIASATKHISIGSGVVLDCIDSRSLHPYLLGCHATVCMPGFKPNHCLLIWFPL